MIMFLITFSGLDSFIRLARPESRLSLTINEKPSIGAPHLGHTLASEDTLCPHSEQRTNIVYFFILTYSILAFRLPLFALFI